MLLSPGPCARNGDTEGMPGGGPRTPVRDARRRGRGVGRLARGQRSGAGPERKALTHSLDHGRLLDDQDPWCFEGSALAADLAACDLVLTRGTPPRTEGCRTVGRGLMTVTHDLVQDRTGRRRRAATGVRIAERDGRATVRVRGGRRSVRPGPRTAAGRPPRRHRGVCPGGGVAHRRHGEPAWPGTGSRARRGAARGVRGRTGRGASRHVRRRTAPSGPARSLRAAPPRHGTAATRPAAQAPARPVPRRGAARRPARPRARRRPARGFPGGPSVRVRAAGGHRPWRPPRVRPCCWPRPTAPASAWPRRSRGTRRRVPCRRGSAR